MPEGLDEIGDYAFKECTSLTEVTIPKGVIKIGELPFSNCSALIKIHLPEHLNGKNLNNKSCKEKNIIMEPYKREFIKFLMSANVLKFGDFTAKSGRKIPYFVNAGEIKTGEQIEKLGEFYAKAYLEKLGNKKTILYGPAYKGISIAVASSIALAGHGLDIPFFFNRKEVKDHGEGGIFVGYLPKPGEEIVITEDVITAGTAIRESMEKLSSLEGVKVAAVFVMVDRKEKGRGEKGAMQEIEEEFGFPVYAVADVYDIMEYLEENPGNEENVTRIKNYLSVNGAKQ